MRCCIYDPEDREFFGGLEVGWTKQERLAKPFDSVASAAKTLRDWKRNPVARRFWIVTLPSMRVN